MRTFLYPAVLTPDMHHHGFVVTFSDVPDAITQGDDLSEALHHAADCLDEAIAGRILRQVPISEASAAGPDQYAIPFSIGMAAKAALYLALQQTKTSQGGVVERFHCDVQEASRLLDPRRMANLPRLEWALATLGFQVTVGVQRVVSLPSSDGQEDGGPTAHRLPRSRDRQVKAKSDTEAERREDFHFPYNPAIFRTSSAT
jgi:antitoxin HicB